MGKPIYKVVTSHQLISASNSTILILDGNVIGISIRVYSDSTVTGLLYGLDEAPKIPLTNNDLPASFGGYHVDGVPCVYEGELQVRWNGTGIGQGVVALTRLVLQPTDQELCD